MSARITVFVILGAVAAPVAQAESPIAEVICAPRQQMEARLTTQFRAALQATGLRGPDTVVEVWADPSGRWTLVQRYAEGQSCILAMGEGWSGLAPPA